MNEIPQDAKLPRNQMKRRIAPGIWEDKDGDIHWSIPELLALVDLPDTAENRQIVTEMLRNMLRKAGSPVIIDRAKPD